MAIASKAGPRVILELSAEEVELLWNLTEFSLDIAAPGAKGTPVLESINRALGEVVDI